MLEVIVKSFSPFGPRQIILFPGCIGYVSLVYVVLIEEMPHFRIGDHLAFVKNRRSDPRSYGQEYNQTVSVVISRAKRQLRKSCHICVIGYVKILFEFLFKVYCDIEMIPAIGYVGGGTGHTLFDNCRETYPNDSFIIGKLCV